MSREKGAVKSVRFSREVETFINAYAGSNFTEKLTNIVLDVMHIHQQIDRDSKETENNKYMEV